MEAISVEDVEIDVDDSVNTIEQEVIAEVSKKRKTRLSGNKTKKKPKTGGPSDVDKNACMLLNEKCHDVVYSLTSQVGPVHMPLFTIQVTVNGQTFEGSGPSKKQAKLAAAKAAVEALQLCIDAENIKKETESIKKETEGDLTSDSDIKTSIPTEVFSSDGGLLTPLLIGKHPVLMLNEIRPWAEYVQIDDESGVRKFTVTVDGQTFEGAGSSKKLAKAKAAEAAMTSLFGLTFSYLRDGQPVYKGDDSLYTKYKLREATASVETVDGKNPVQMLNELFQELHYEYVDVSNEVTVGTKFCVVLEIEGQTYRGEGTTKKMAKGNCAMAAVKALTASGVIKSLMAEKDAKKKRASRHVTGTSNSSLLDSAVIKLAVHFPDLQYRLVSQNDLWKNGQTLSSVAVTVRGETFFGSGPTENSAKNQVASKVLTKFGLWSADDQRLKQETARVEADSTITSVVRGAKAGGRKFSGRGFIGRGVGRGTSRGIGRGWNFSTSGFDGFSSMTSAYIPSVKKENPGLEQVVSSSEWHVSSVPSATAGITSPLQDRKSFGRGTGITGPLAQTAEFVTSRDTVNVRGRGSFRRGRDFAEQARYSNRTGETWDTEGLKGTNRSGSSWHSETQDTSHAPSSEWLASSMPSATTGTTNPLQDGISFGRGAGIINAFAQTTGFATSKDNVNVRGSGSFRRGGEPFHDSTYQGHLGQGSQSQPEISAGIRGDGIGRGRSRIDYPGQPSCNVGYNVESRGRYWQSDFSLPQESSGNTYQSSTTSTFGNKAATRGKSDGYSSGSSVKNTYSLSTQKHPNQKDTYFTSTRNFEKNQDFVDQTRNSNWMGETWNTEGLKGTNTYGSSWHYETQDSSHALSAVNYAETDNAYAFNNEIPFSGNSKTETHLTTSQANEYFGSSSYEYESAGGYGDLYGNGSGYSYEH